MNIAVSTTAETAAGPARRGDQGSATITRSIVCARVFAIFFMMYVHAWAGEVKLPDDAFTGGFGLFAEILVDILGRSSVPLLTIISGYLLVAVSYRRKVWREVVADKFRTLLVPLWVWNGLFLLMIWAGIQLTGAPAPDYVAGKPWYDSVFALTDAPATLPLNFLRDMFVCALLSPLLIWLVRRAPWLTLAAGLLFAIFKPEQVIILRHQLLLFYLVGLAYAIHWKVPLQPRIGLATVAAASIVVGWFLLADHTLAGPLVLPEPVRQILANLSRFGVAWLVWMLCLWLQTTRAYPAFARVEVIVFIAFCSHFILFRLIGQIAPDSPQLLPFIFLAQPVIALAASFAMVLVLRPTLPGLLKFLNGGRVPQLRQGG